MRVMTLKLYGILLTSMTILGSSCAASPPEPVHFTTVLTQAPQNCPTLELSHPSTASSRTRGIKPDATTTQELLKRLDLTCLSDNHDLIAPLIIDPTHH